MQWLRTGQHWGKCNLASPCCMLLSGFEGKSCCSGQLTRVPLWYFVTLTLKSNESEISSGCHSLGSKMYHLLGLWISDFFFLIQSWELLNCILSLLCSLWKEMGVWKMYCTEGQRKGAVAAAMLFLTWFFLSLCLFVQMNFLCSKRALAKLSIMFMLQRLILPTK